MFSSIITPTNLTEDSRLISILLRVKVGKLNGILSHALRKSNGPSMEPCGTPHRKTSKSVFWSRHFMNSFLFVR